ncbi:MULTISPECIES: TolC family protein [Acidobacteriaceae]|uniref:TolC family protein n=1 Tax=Acidobacteriaceae TaxID=204434 RepID=UPI00131D97D5|nr:MULTISPECIES: TolC family protein [Acidobacteriaceae]MDW5266333.1 TolC family protein [Edaphobacter sp.]
MGNLNKVSLRGSLSYFATNAKVCLLLAVCGSLSVAAHAQDSAEGLPSAPTPHTLTAKFPGGVTVQQATPSALPLSLDEAIEQGVKNNLQMELARQNQRIVHGQVLTVANNLLPSLTAEAFTETQMINLAALGFKPSLLAKFGLDPATFPTVIKLDTTGAQLNMNQQLFNVPAYYLYRSAQKAETAATMTTRNSEGTVVLKVGTQYLLALADASQIENAQALEKADELVLQQATASHDAGVGTNLDVLRARVQLQTQQQTVINAENTFAKDKIALNRLIGLPAEQELTLTDKTPYSEFAELPLDQAMALAYTRRKDLLSLQAQQEVAERAEKAVKYERLPTLSFDGHYGVLGETHGLYHGIFAATGSLKVPIFQEGQLRGEREVANAQVTALHQQITSLRVTIEQQIRSAMLDVQSSNQLVKVARSNVDLATEELQQATDRFQSGVSDNLPVVQAEASLADAQTKLVQTLYQYNQSKLMLARNTGVVESQYKVYLGR